MLSKEKSDEIKEKLLKHIEKTFSGKEKENMIKQIDSLSPDKLENFLKENNVGAEGEQEIFRLIVSGKIPSHKIGENEEAIAVLEINPISKGHSLIIPIKQIKNPKDISEKIVELSKDISEKIKNVFNPKDVQILKTSMFGEVIINILPIYEDESMDSERKKLDEKELEGLKNEFETSENKKDNEEEEIPTPQPEEEINDKNMWLPKEFLKLQK